MFDIVKDYHIAYDDSVKKIKLSELSGIYFNHGNNDFIFFESFNGKWTYETRDGKFDYGIPDNFTLEDLVNQLQKNNQLSEDFTVRVYDYADEKKKISNFIKTIIPGKRKLINQEIFGNFELQRLKDVNKKIYQDDPENLDKFLAQMDIVYSDVSQIVRLISAQAHTPETLNLTMTLVSNILSSVPITPITDDELSTKDWVDYDEVEEKNIRKYLDLLDNENEITSVLLNIRCSRILKVTYHNSKTDKDEVVYYDTTARVYINQDDGEAYYNSACIDSIELPWSFKPIEEIRVTSDDEIIKDSVKFKEMF